MVKVKKSNGLIEHARHKGSGKRRGRPPTVNNSLTHNVGNKGPGKRKGRPPKVPKHQDVTVEPFHFKGKVSTKGPKSQSLKDVARSLLSGTQSEYQVELPQVSSPGRQRHQERQQQQPATVRSNNEDTEVVVISDDSSQDSVESSSQSNRSSAKVMHDGKSRGRRGSKKPNNGAEPKKSRDGAGIDSESKKTRTPLAKKMDSSSSPRDNGGLTNLRVQLKDLSPRDSAGLGNLSVQLRDVSRSMNLSAGTTSVNLKGKKRSAKASTSNDETPQRRPAAKVKAKVKRPSPDLDEEESSNHQGSSNDETPQKRSSAKVKAKEKRPSPGLEEEESSLAKRQGSSKKTTPGRKKKNKSSVSSTDQPMPWSAAFSALSNDAGVMIHLKPGTRYSFKGQCLIQCLSGSLKVNGYVITAGPKQHVVCALNGFTPLPVFPERGSSVRDLPSERQCISQEETETLNRLDALTELSGKGEPILLIKPWSRSPTKFLRTLNIYELLVQSYKNDQVWCQTGANIVPSQEEEALLEYGDDYAAILNCISEIKKEKDCPRIIVCGGRNNGKSSLCRYLTNYVLSNHQEPIGFLDLDPGQCEFTPSGCLSYVSLTSPLLSPPSFHMDVGSKFSVFLGCNTPSYDLDLYFDCVENLTKRMEEDTTSSSAVIINTMGWTQGVGTNIMATLISLVKPDLLIQINSMRSANKNYPAPLDETFVHANQLQERPIPNYDLLTVDATTVVPPSLWGSFRLRTMAALSHFYPCIEPLYAEDPKASFASCAPFAISWSCLWLHLCYSPSIPPEGVLAVLNGSMVSLCSIDPQKAKDASHPGNPKVLKTNVIGETLGFGIVRAIDVTKELLFIVTPLSEERLQKVNCIKKGLGVDTPEELLSTQNAPSEDWLYWGDVSMQGLGRTIAATTGKPRKYFKQPVGAFT